MNKDAAVEAIAGLDKSRLLQYEEYFQTLLPKTVEDVFRRWLFAYASVHTTYKSNVELYKQLRDLRWLGDRQELYARIVRSKAGMQNKRTDYIMRFTDWYWQHAGWFTKASHETWFEHRDRIMERAPGIGPAKAAFLLELLHFHHAEVVCSDTHFCQLYGFTPKEYAAGTVRDRDIAVMERHWVQACKERGIAPVTARWCLWDIKNNQLTPAYWSYILEHDDNKQTSEIYAENDMAYITREEVRTMDGDSRQLSTKQSSWSPLAVPLLVRT